MSVRVIPGPASRERSAAVEAGHVACHVAVAFGLLVATVATPARAAPPSEAPAGASETGSRRYSGRAAVPAPALDATPEPTPAVGEGEVAAPPTAGEPAAASAADDEAWEDEAWDDDEDAWDDDYDPLRDSPEAIAAKRRVIGGGVLMLVGGATVLGALAMGLSDPCARPAGNSCSPASRNRAAVTMGLPGGAILVAGAVVFGLARRQQSRLRLDAALSPRRGASLSLTARF